MTERQEYFAAYPRELAAGGQDSDRRYRRALRYFAVPCKIAEENTLPIMWQLYDDGISVLEGTPNDLVDPVAPEDLRPVYRPMPDGGLVVPTGAVFVRFEDGIAADSRRQMLAESGYEIASIPIYAPHCAWLRPDDGAVSSGLNRVAGLMALADVAFVEPEMLGERAQR